MSYEDSAGLGSENHYGARKLTGKYGQEIAYDGEVKTIEYLVNYNDLPVDGTSGKINVFPANSMFISCNLEVITGFAGGTSYTVGLTTSAGSVLDADGLMTATELVLANMNVAGDIVIGAGALILTSNTAVVTAACQLDMIASGTFTAGQARIRVKYVPPRTSMASA